MTTINEIKTLDEEPKVKFNGNHFELENEEYYRKRLEQVLKVAGDFKVNEDNLTEARSLRSKINKLITYLEDGRKNITKQYIKPFEAEINELEDIVKPLEERLGKDINSFAKTKKETKKNHINSVVNELATGYGLDPDKVQFNNDWLKTKSELELAKQITSELKLMQKAQSNQERDLNIINGKVCDLDTGEFLDNYQPFLAFGTKEDIRLLTELADKFGINFRTDISDINC